MKRFFTLPQFIGIIAATILLLIYNWLDYAPYFALFVIVLLVFQFVYIADIENKKKIYNSFKVEIEQNINNIEWLQNKKNEIKEQMSLNVGSKKINRLKLEKLESVLLFQNPNNIGNKDSNNEIGELNEKIYELNEENSNKTIEINRLTNKIYKLEKENNDCNPEEITKLKDEIATLINTIKKNEREQAGKVIVKPLTIKNRAQVHVAVFIYLMHEIGLLEGDKIDAMRTIGDCCNCNLEDFANRINNLKNGTGDKSQQKFLYLFIEAFEKEFNTKIRR